MVSVEPPELRHTAVPARRATRAELLVVRNAVADPLVPQADRIRETGLSRRTYQTAQARVFRRRWVQVRYLPAAQLLPRARLLFALVRPVDVHPMAVRAAVGEKPHVLTAWASPSWLFVVAILPAGDGAAAIGARLARVGSIPPGWMLSCRPTPAELPAYFDFEAEWARYGGLGGTLRYPQGFARAEVGPADRARPAPPERVTRAAEALIVRAARRPLPERPAMSRWVPWASPFVERGLLRQGWVVARGFLDPVSVGRSVFDFAEAITWVHGPLRGGSSPAGLRADLHEAARAYPFLLASDQRAVLLGFLSAGPRTRLGPAPTARATVRELLERHLETFTAVRGPLDEVERILTHRYDRAFRPFGRTGGPGPDPAGRGSSP